jgi:hypothetical protein
MGDKAYMSKAQLDTQMPESGAPKFDPSTLPYVPDTPKRPGIPGMGNIPQYGGPEDVPQLQALAMQDLANDPGYQFEMEQGTRGIEAGASAGGTLHSGRTLKELAKYQQGLASTRFNEAFQRRLQEHSAEMGVSQEEQNRRMQEFGADVTSSEMAQQRGQYAYGADVAREQGQYGRGLQDYQMRDASASQQYQDMINAYNLQYGRATDIYNIQNQEFAQDYNRIAGLAGYAAQAAPQMSNAGLQAGFNTAQGLRGYGQDAASMGMYQGNVLANVAQTIGNLGTQAIGAYQNQPQQSPYLQNVPTNPQYFQYGR